MVRNTGSSYIVRTDDGEQVECRVKGNFRLKGIRTTNPVAVGDGVVLRVTEADEIAFIVAIGIVSFMAQEKSTIKKDLALIKFLVKR